MSAARARHMLGLVSGLCFAALAYLSVTYLSPGDMGLFDTRPLGYDLNDARAYVGALSMIERAIYSGPFRALDTLFPFCFAAFLAMMLHDRTRGWGAIPQLLLVILPGSYLVMDLAENALVSQIVLADLSTLRAEPVNLASRFTVTKYVMLGATVAAIAAAQLLGRRI
jgi:hypothetical protein